MSGFPIFIQRTPHALHKVCSPAGPCRFCGVFRAPQHAHAHGGFTSLEVVCAGADAGAGSSLIGTRPAKHIVKVSWPALSAHAAAKPVPAIVAITKTHFVQIENARWVLLVFVGYMCALSNVPATIQWVFPRTYALRSSVGL